MNGINLIPAAVLERRRRGRRIRVWSGVTAVYGALVAGSYGAFATAGRLQNTHHRVAELARLVEQERAELTSLRDRAAEAMREADAARMMASHPDWSVLLTLLARPLTADMALESCELSRIEPPRADTGPAGAPPPRPATPGPDSFRLSLTGLARTQSQVTGYVLELERLGGEGPRLFQSVTLVEAKGRRISTTDVVSFRVECVLAPRASGAGGGGAR